VQLSSSVTSRVVAVQPSIVGRVASGYALTAVRYSPQAITISGQQGQLNNIDAVSTSNISINGLTGNVTVNVQLQLPDGVTASAGTVNVTLVVTAIAPATPTPTPTPTPPVPT
jgi:YbbR domain-containing protein